MPIRFHCKRCHQLLGIATRKAGSEIHCPKCGVSQVVPNEEAAAAAMAMNELAKTQQAVENMSSPVVYDDLPAAIETSRSPEAEHTAPTQPTGAILGAPAAPAQNQSGEPIPQGMILFPRRAFYVQGLLFLALFAVAFGSGYFIGRGDANHQKQVEREGAVKERVLIEGNLVYNPGTGRLVGDENAVVIALPEGKFPGERISYRGIRPQDPPPDETHKSIRMIRQLGGDYARADAPGDFSIVVPDRGSYRLLIISNHATRPKGADVDEVHLSEMEGYFGMAGPLIGRSKYCWTLREIAAPIRIDHNFGLDGQE